MKRQIIATILAAALSVTSINVGTAQAGDRDAVRFIVGATALAIIGSALAAEQRRNAHASTQGTHQPPQYKPPHHKQPQYTQPHHKPRYDQYPQHNRPKAKQRRVSVPRYCLMTVRGHSGWTEGYAVRCAQRSTRATLPSDCVRRNFAQGPRLFYAPQCLRRNGFDA